MSQFSLYLHVHTQRHIYMYISVHIAGFVFNSEEIKQLWSNLFYHDRNYEDKLPSEVTIQWLEG